MSNINNIVYQNYNEGKVCNALGQCWNTIKDNPGKTAATVGGAAAGAAAGRKLYDSYKSKGSEKTLGDAQSKAQSISKLIGSVTAGLKAFNQLKK